MRPKLRETFPVFALLLAVACGGGKKGDTDKPGMDNGEATPPAARAAAERLPAIPNAPAPLPSAVLAALSVGEPQGQLAGMAAFADAVQPGFGAMLAPAQLVQGVAAVVGVPGLDGVDLTRPLHLLLLDPQKGGGQALLVVAVADKQKMAGSVGGGAVMQVHGGYAAIGTGSALQVASPYALSNVAMTSPPKHAHGVIYMNRIMDAYGAQLDATLRQSLGQNPAAAEKMAAESMVKMLSSIERIEGDLEASGQVATTSFTVFPEQGSALASWGALQKPSDYSVAARLPAGTWLMVAAGRIDWAGMEDFWKAMVAAQGRPEMADWVGVFGQELALALLVKQDKTLRMAGLVSVADEPKLGQLVKAYVTRMAGQPKQMDSMRVQTKANAYKTGGASLHGMTIQPGPEAAPNEKKEFEKAFGKSGLKSYFGLASSWLVMTLDKETGAKALAAKLVKSVKSKQPKTELSQSFERALADSKTRNESGIMMFDLSALAPDPAQAQGAELAIGLGFDGPVMRSRMTLPPATIRFFVQQQMRGAASSPPPPAPPTQPPPPTKKP